MSEKQRGIASCTPIKWCFVLQTLASEISALREDVAALARRQEGKEKEKKTYKIIIISEFLHICDFVYVIVYVCVSVCVFLCMFLCVCAVFF